MRAEAALFDALHRRRRRWGRRRDLRIRDETRRFEGASGAEGDDSHTWGTLERRGRMGLEHPHVAQEVERVDVALQMLTHLVVDFEKGDPGAVALEQRIVARPANDAAQA